MMGNGTRALLGVIFGIILMFVGIIWYVVDVPVLSGYLDTPITFTPFWKILALFILGLFGICIFFIGLVLTWMGWEDYKMANEMVEDAAYEKQTEEEIHAEKEP
jgi:hypothetical protein